MKLDKKKLRSKTRLRAFIKYYTTIIKQSPDDIDSFFKRSFFYYAINDFQKALEDCNRVLELDPDNIVAHCFRGLIYSKLEQFKQATQEFYKSMELDSSFSQAYMGRAILKYFRNKLEGAKEDLDNLLKVDPGNSRAYLYRSYINLLTSSFQSALSDCAKSLELMPSLESKVKKSISEIYLKGGIKNSDEGNYEAAIEFFKKYVMENPNDANGYFYLGEAYMNLEDFKNARINLEKASNLDRDGKVGEDARELMDIFDDIADIEAED